MRFTAARTKTLSLALTAAVAISSLGAGAVLAQDGGDGPPAPNQDHSRPAHAAHRLFKGMLKSIVEHSGLEPSEFREGFAAGKSINQVLEENGVSPADIEAQVLADLKAKLDAAVTQGTLDQEQADRIYAAAEEKIVTLMNRVPDPDGHHHRPGAGIRPAIKGMIGSAAEALDMEPRALAERLRGGETVTEIADAAGIDLESVKVDLLASASARIDAKVADGSLAPERAAEMKSHLEARIESFLTEGPGKHE